MPAVPGSPSPRQQRLRRTRVVASTFALLNAISIAGALLLNGAAQPTAYPDREASLKELAASAQRAVDAHPFGGLLVPYEHEALERFAARAREPADAAEWLERERSYASSAVHVFYIVLGEMTWLLSGLYLLGLGGALMAFSAKPGWVIAGAVLMLLAAPVPIVSVGPESALLTSYLFVGGVLLLIVKPRIERAALTQQEAASAGREARNMILTGVGLLALGGVGIGLALSVRSAHAKLWVGAVGCLVGGLVCVVWGLGSLGASRRT